MTVRAGLALTVIISPGLNGLALVVSFVAGLKIDATFIIPGTTNTLFLFAAGFARSAAIMRPRVSNTPATCLRLMPTLSAMIVKISVFLRCLEAGVILTGLGAGALPALLAMVLSSCVEKGFSPKNPAFSASAERLYHRAGGTASGRGGKNADFWGFLTELRPTASGSPVQTCEKVQVSGQVVPGA